MTSHSQSIMPGGVGLTLEKKDFFRMSSDGTGSVMSLKDAQTGIIRH